MSSPKRVRKEELLEIKSVLRNGRSQTQAHHGRRNLCVITNVIIILPGQFRPLSLISVKIFFHETLNIAKEFLSMLKEVEWSPKYCLYPLFGISSYFRGRSPYNKCSSTRQYFLHLCEEKNASISFKHFDFCSLSEQITFSYHSILW